MLLGLAASQNRIVPATPPPEVFVAPNFQQWDGFTPMDHPAGQADPGTRPGAGETPLSEQTYTPSTLQGLTNTLGGQPLPVSERIHAPAGSATVVTPLSMQFRSGVGQNYQGAAQSVLASEITGNPPVPGDITSIIAGWG